MNRRIEIPPPRLYIYRKKLMFVWKWNYSIYNNKLQNNRICQNLDEHTIFIGFDPKWYERFSSNYDGHIAETFTFLGIIVGKTSSYQWDTLT